jgi:uncharacterized protein YndB with AHSA1/START domain
MNDVSQRIAPAAIRKTIDVKVPVDRAFAVFASRIGEWWHNDHSLAEGKKQADVVIEPHAGGRWYELADDGSEYEWGKVLSYEPPHRLVLAWQLTREFDYDPSFETTVEVRFEETVEGTRVHFEHRDLERMGEGAIETFESMDGGWGMLLDLFRQAAEGS